MTTALDPHKRHITDTRTALSVTLKQKSTSGVLTVVDLTGCTVKFKMVDGEGNVAIAETSTGVTVDSILTGQVSYDFSSSGVITGGTYFGYFVVYNASLETDHFPVEHRQLRIILSAD